MKDSEKKEYIIKQNKDLVFSNPMYPNAKWYIIQTASNAEWKAMQNIEVQLKLANLHHKVHKIICPSIQSITNVNGVKKKVINKLYSSYLFIFAELDMELCSLIVRTNKVSSFIAQTSADKLPAPVSKVEMEKIINLVLNEEIKKISPFAAGDRVKIEEGPFSGFDATIIDVDLSDKKLDLEIFVFNNPTKITMKFNQVSK